MSSNAEAAAKDDSDQHQQLLPMEVAEEYSEVGMYKPRPGAIPIALCFSDPNSASPSYFLSFKALKAASQYFENRITPEYTTDHTSELPQKIVWLPGLAPEDTSAFSTFPLWVSMYEYTNPHMQEALDSLIYDTFIWDYGETDEA